LFAIFEADLAGNFFFTTLLGFATGLEV